MLTRQRTIKNCTCKNTNTLNNKIHWHTNSDSVQKSYGPRRRTSSCTPASSCKKLPKTIAVWNAKISDAKISGTGAQRIIFNIELPVLLRSLSFACFEIGVKICHNRKVSSADAEHTTSPSGLRARPRSRPSWP